MQRLPQYREPRGAEAAVHLLLTAAAILSVWNLAVALRNLDARKDLIADALFRPQPAAIAVAAARTNDTTSTVAEPTLSAPAAAEGAKPPSEPASRRNAGATQVPI